MTKLTEQIIFDTVVEHFKTQKVPAANAYGACLYRGPNGTKCAVGILITDDEYDPAMDTAGTVEGLEDEGYLPKRLEPFQADKFRVEYPSRYLTETFLTHLQVIHDRVVTCKREVLLDPITAGELRALANARGLDASKVDWA